MTKPVDPDTAIALRRVHAFPPARLSAFEDPADEKSSHGSQRYSALTGFYGDREPSWYANATRDFEGLDRVLDIGTGPGLCLDALSAHGVREPIGIDRWQGFRRDAEAAGRTVILHDLTLPMPFLRSGSFDGVFSHYALDYMSPIGVQQVLREARRLLAPGGLMVLYLAGAGLALGDQVRTTPYGEAAFSRMLSAAGFEDFRVEQPEDRRNTVVRARGPGPESGAPAEGELVIEHEAGGEMQLAAGIRPPGPAGDQQAVALEVGDGERSFGCRVTLPSVSAGSGVDAILDLSLCARLVAVEPGEFALSVWTWRGSEAATAETMRLRLNPGMARMRLELDRGALEDQGAWVPEPPMVELPGDAYVPVDRASPSRGADDKWRARGRQVIVEREGDDPDELLAATESKDRFLVRRPDPAAPLEIDALDRDWKAERLQGIVLELEAALRPESLPLLLWAGFRGTLVYIEPASWAEVGEVARRLSSLASPLLIVDPTLSGLAAPDSEVPHEESVAAALESAPGLHLVLAAGTSERVASLWKRYPTRLLIGETGHAGGEELGHGQVLDEATETLRYLTERTTLIWFRGTSGRTGEELGRLSPLASV